MEVYKDRATQTFTVTTTRSTDIFLAWDDPLHRGMISSLGGTETYEDLVGTIANTSYCYDTQL